MNQKTYPHGPTYVCLGGLVGGGVKRQIDYIAVSRKYQNFGLKANIIQEWRGNQERRQRAKARLEIRSRVKKR